jgi:hypothetical protein
MRYAVSFDGVSVVKEAAQLSMSVDTGMLDIQTF